MKENSNSRIKNNKLLKHTWFIILVLFTFTACELLDIEKQVMIGTGEVTDITPFEASVKGILYDVGEDGVTQYGHVWSTNTNLSINLTTKTELGSKYWGEMFTSNLTGLKSLTMYYVKAYASTGSGKTFYSNQVFFTTKVIEYPQPVAHWKLEDDVTDEFETSDGILINGDASSYIDGQVGRGLDLSSPVTAIRYIEVPDNEIIDFDTNSFSISMLVKVPGFVGSRELIFKGDNSNDVDGHWYALAMHNNNLIMYIDDSIDKTQFENPNIDNFMSVGEWNHIVAVRDRDQDSLFLYINGEKISSFEDFTNRSISSPGLPLRIGTNAAGFASADRQIDEIMLYNVALLANEVLYLYQSLDFN